MTDSDSTAAFLDTNVCLRYLLGDDAALSARAIRVIDGTRPLLLTDAVIAEVGFVLLRFYKVPRETVIDSLVALVRRSNISVWHIDKDVIVEALLLCRPSTRVSLVDALLWAIARSAGAGATIYSFDNRFPTGGIDVRREL